MGKASAAWTVVSLGLTMVSNNIDRREAMFESSEYPAENLAYYALVDTHYRDEKVEGGQNLDRALVRVYTAILEYTAEVKKVVWLELGAKKWADFTNTLRDRERAKQILDGVDEGLALSRNVHSTVLKGEEKDIMTWMSALPFSDIQQTTQGYRTADTGSWLLECPEYQEWKSSPGSVLWLPGVVGCGKSVLCSTVIRDIEKLCGEDCSKSIGYWYFQFTHDRTQSVDSMTRSLIRQLSRSPVVPSVRKCWEEHDRKGSRPSQEKIIGMLNDVVASMPGDVFVVIDALDECPMTGKARHHLLSLLVDLAQRHQQNIHILATSRPEQDILAIMERFSFINLEERLANDVETFVRAALEDDYLRESEADIKSSIIDALLNKGERRFRWADLQIKRFQKCPTDERIRDALRTIPPTIEATYQTILDRIEKEGNSPLARQMLMLLAFPVGPLDLKHVSDGIVRLAHFSVKEFLVVSAEADTGDRCRFSETAANQMLATKTVDFLLKKTDELDEAASMKHAFLVYATANWHTHVAALGDTSLWPEGLPDKVDRLFTEPIVYFNWVRIAESAAHPVDCQWDKRLEECKPPIYSAAERSLLRTVDLLVDGGADPLQRLGALRRSPFDLAVETGDLELVDLLLKKNLPITADHLVLSTLVMLSLAGGKGADDISKSKLRAVMDTMRELGLLFDPPRSSEKIISETVIHRAMMNNTAGLEMVRQFLGWREMGLVSFSFPSDIVRIATCFAFDLEDMFDLLFQRCEDEIQIPPTLFNVAGQLPWMRFERLAALTRRKSAELTMHDTLVRAMAEFFNRTDMDFVLRARPDIRVTESVLVHAAKNEQGLDVFFLLWDRREQGISITEDVLVGAAGNGGSQDILQFLIDKLAADVQLADKVMEEAIANLPKGLSMVRAIWGSHKASFDISANMIELAIGRSSAPMEMLELLRNNSTTEVPVSEAMMCAAAGNRRNAPDLITYLSQMQEEPIPVTEKVTIAAINSDPGTMEMLLDKFPGACPYHGPNTNDRPPDLVLDILLERELVTAHQKLLEAVAGKYETLTTVLSRAPDIPISHRALVEAAKDPRSIRLLLDKQDVNTPNTEDLIVGATDSGEDWKFREVVEAIVQRTGSAQITEKVFRAALCTGLIDAFPWLFEQRPDLDITVDGLFDAVWQDVEVPAMKKLVAFFGLAAFHDDEEREITVPLMERYPYSRETKENYGLDEILKFLAGDGAEMPMSDSQGMAEIFVERCGLTAVENFLKSRPGIVISDSLVQAAEKNLVANRDELLTFLEKRRAR
ncbi:hypothetical protein FE257_011418 [Aspergillus nanangensis]|uniref:Nephrocystin 3-like N-terminal domain-containing protein n=1 Tax=Aspergillus nanangensis TaxID=2582783 RepID=A0AAD4GRG1_ASPNN|nr:hypothetical protein FE257_011418 [Aspergillus nanangensis]